MKKLAFLSFIWIIIGTTDVKAQYKVLYNFTESTGRYPRGNITISGSILFGMTERGGTQDSGLIFSFDTNGKIYSVLHAFSNLTGGGAVPRASLYLIGNKLFGMTEFEGKYNYGIAFSINTNGTGYKDILDFEDSNSPYGDGPWGDLILSGNKLYGMTYGGGSVSGSYGVAFCIDTNGGGYEDIFNFTGGANGKQPWSDVTIAGNKLYGMTSLGGIYGDGNIFSMDTGGAGYVDLLDFNGTNGNDPSGSLTLSGRKLYGTTYAGGLHNDGLIFSVDTDGSGYKDLLDFDGSNGQTPNGSLILFKGALYGMTFVGGAHNLGCIFSIDTNGNNYRDLVDLNDSIGVNPLGSLTLSGDMLFGMTEEGGAYGGGVIFCFKDTAIKAEDAVNNIKPSTETINVYPNPNNGSFNLSLSNPASYLDETFNVEIFNVLGEKLFSESMQNPSSYNLNLIEKPNGMYFYKVLGEDGAFIGCGKVVIEK